MPARPVPRVGLPVAVVHLGAVDDAEVEAVLDEGRTLVVAGERFTLRRASGRFVREGEPSYGTRLRFRTRPTMSRNEPVQ